MHKKRRTWTSVTWKQVGARQRWACAHCGKLVDETAELDHVIPLSSPESTESMDNAQLLCVLCHKRKSQREEQDRIVALRQRLAERTSTADATKNTHTGRRKHATAADILESVLDAPMDTLDFSQYVFHGFLDRKRRPLSLV